MTRHEAIEKAAIDVANELEAELNAKYPASVREFPCMQKDFDGDMQSVIALRAALALPEDSKTVNAELYGLAVAMADYCARTDIEFASTKEFAEFIGLPGIELDKIMEAMQNANRYLSLRESSGEPMPYKVVREGEKIRFE